MDLLETLRDLYAQRETLNRAIAALEDMARSSGPGLPARGGNRRGRKSMGAEERQEVSERMKRYWETRRASPTTPRERFKASSGNSDGT